MIIIGLTGAATSGKGLVSARLQDRHGFTVSRFAEPIKAMLAVGLGLTHEQLDGAEKHLPIPELGGLTTRHLMQTLGTEWGRIRVHSDLWVNAWRRIVPDVDRLVVDDVRFPNEALAIRGMGGVIWRVDRPSVPVMNHVSERSMREIAVDGTIQNTTTIAALHAATDATVEAFLAGLFERTET